VTLPALVFVYGLGGNGKSVFLNTVTGILADYAAVAAMDTFTASHTDRHPTGLAMLRGARLVTASETEEGRAWAESRIKQMARDPALDWQANGLHRPEVVRAATDAYFADQDLFGQWLDEVCDAEPGNTYKWETTAKLFEC